MQSIPPNVDGAMLCGPTLPHGTDTLTGDGETVALGTVPCVQVVTGTVQGGSRDGPIC
jgi:hypothetical protein